jgi:hypothetical protein
MRFVLETRDKPRYGEWTLWVDLTPGLRYERDEIVEFNDTLESSDFGDSHSRTQWRARLLPEFGYEVIHLNSRDNPAVFEADPPLARDMPASVHALNDALLTILGS